MSRPLTITGWSLKQCRNREHMSSLTMCLSMGARTMGFPLWSKIIHRCIICCSNSRASMLRIRTHMEAGPEKGCAEWETLLNCIPARKTILSKQEHPVASAISGSTQSYAQALPFETCGKIQRTTDGCIYSLGSPQQTCPQIEQTRAIDNRNINIHHVQADCIPAYTSEHHHRYRSTHIIKRTVTDPTVGLHQCQ